MICLFRDSIHAASHRIKSVEGFLKGSLWKKIFMFRKRCIVDIKIFRYFFLYNFCFGKVLFISACFCLNCFLTILLFLFSVYKIQYSIKINPLIILLLINVIFLEQKFLFQKRSIIKKISIHFLF